jgi:Flp pilus assembly protein CpaB
LAYGWVKPNDHVDILAHLELPGRGSTTLTVLQDVTLVSVGSATILSETGKISGGDISFFVDPEEYELLSFAEQKARFSVSLRNPKDLKVRDSSQGIDMNAFLDSRRIKKASGGGALDVIEEGQKVKQ